MGSRFKELDVLDSLYSDENPSEVNLKRLAELLGIKQTQLATGLHLEETSISRKPYASQNSILNQWLTIFNLIIKIISDTQPELETQAIKVKMQRWLKLPRPEFDGQSALDFMLRGKSRQVKHVLEQILL